MKNTIVINDCGKMKKVYRSKLYELFLKSEIRKDKKDFRRKLEQFGAYYDWKESNVVLAYLHKTISIQLYKDGCIRLFLNDGNAEWGFVEVAFCDNVFIQNVSDEVIEILHAI